MSNFVNLMDIIYPIGSVYISFNSTSPAASVGGTWELLDNVFLYGTSGTIGVKGGESDHILTTNEMPKHQHALKVAIHWGGEAGALRSVVATNYDFWQGGDIDNGTYDSNNSTSFVGAGQPHNNMPPYITCRMYKRTH